MSGNKLITAGQNRLRKADDAKVDPAVPAELQKSAASAASTLSDPAGVSVTSVFAGGRVLTANDITGTPEEQLSYVTERLQEIDALGKRAEDFTVLNKGALLEVAQERELHLVAGHTNFAQWAAGVLDVEPKYVFELLQDAARIRTVGALGTDLAQHLTRASARKVMAEVIGDQGVEFAEVVMTEGMSRAIKQGKKRPTAALLSSIAKELAAPTIPHQEQRSEISDPPAPPSATAHVEALERAANALQERVFPALAPARVKAALEADAAAGHEHLQRLRVELERVTKRLAAALKASAPASNPDGE
ncbi:hypothetical protein [Streptomyces sp. NPDC006309]|uniref:hypothetical protein n=1 Tax=Streptomyces sp. NPDC006309 TaxID=3156749 RepID=UPI0033B1778D